MTFAIRRTLGVSGVGALLLAALVMALNGEPGQTGVVPSPRAADGGAAPGDAPMEDVKLEALQWTRPEIEGAQRNLFRFQARPASPSPRSASPAAPAEPAPPVASRSGPPPPPIPVKFIGLVDTPFTQQVDAATGRIDIVIVHPGDPTSVAGTGLLSASLFDAVGGGPANMTVTGTAIDPRGAPVALQFGPAPGVTVR